MCPDRLMIQDFLSFVPVNYRNPVLIMLYLDFSDLEKVREGIGDKLSLLLQFVAQFVSGFAIGFWKSWRMTLVMMSLTPILAVLAAYFSTV